MLRCREVSKLVSDSMEQNLSLRQRMTIQMHLMMCRMCAGFSRHARLLRHAARENPERLAPADDDPGANLTDEARQRIKSTLSGNSE